MRQKLAVLVLAAGEGIIAWLEQFLAELERVQSDNQRRAVP
jgi:hypothetical protein